MFSGLCSKIRDCCDSLFTKSSQKQNIQVEESSPIQPKSIPLLEFSSNRSKSSTTPNKSSSQSPSSLTKVTLGDFKIIKTLGKGAFGKVILVYNDFYDKFAQPEENVAVNRILSE